MADRLKGITLEIGGDTTKLSKALSGVNSDIINTKSALKDVERLLKLDPGNVELLRQKQKLLATSVKETSEKLKTLKAASEQAAKTADKYDAWKAAYDPIQKEIESTNKALLKLTAQQKEMQDCGEIDTEAYKQLQAEVENSNKKLRELREQAKAVTDEFGNPISPEQFDSLQREIVETENNLKNLQKESRDFGSVFTQQLDAVGDKLTAVGGKITDVGQKFLPVTGAVVGLGTMAFKEASDLAESENKVEVAFGSASDSVMDWANTTLDAYGIAKGTSLDMAALFGDMATSMGFTDEKAAEMSMTLVGLTGDLASFKNIGLDQAGNALKGIFTGETESLKSIGVIMNETNLLQYAIQKGMIDTSKSSLQQQKEALACEKAYDAYTKAVKKHGYSSLEAKDAYLKYVEAVDKSNEVAKASLDTLSQSELVMLRYNYVMDKTQNAHGDFARTSDGSANSLRIMQESTKELSDAFGELLLPIITPIIQKITEVIKYLTGLDEYQKKTILTIAGIVAAVAPVLIVIGQVLSGIGSICHAISSTGPAISFFSEKVLPVLSSAFSGILSFVTGTVLPGLSSAISGAFSFITGTVLPGLSSAFSSVFTFIAANPIVLLIAAIVALVALIATKGDEIQAILQKVDDFLQGVFVTDWTEVFGPVLGGILNTFFATFSGIWDSIKQVLDGVIDIIRGVFTNDWERVWEGVKEIFSGIFTGLEAIAEAPLNGIIGLLNMIIDGANWCIEKLNQIPGVNIDTFGSIPFLAKGGTVYSGSAVVGDAGPEILTVSGGKATVTPLTGSGAAGGAVPAVSSEAIRTFVEVNFGGSLSQLAAVLQPAIVAETQRLGGSFTR